VSRRRGTNAVVVAATVASGAVLLLGAVLFAVLGNSDGDAGGDADAATDDAGWHGAPLGEAQPRPDFTLTDTDGRPFDFAAETRGKLTLLFFGYTSCPDVCPIHMATLSAALEQPGMPEPTVVFVSTDPQRDTPERLREWLGNFDPDFIGLRGTLDQVHAAERAAGVAASMIEADSGGADDDYAVGHAAQLLAYTPDDLAHVAYPFGVRRQDWRADLPRLLEVWGTAQSSDITVDDAWTTAGDEVAAVYLSVDNAGEDDRLVSATSEAAGSVSLMGPTDDATMADGPTDDDDDDGIDLNVPSGTTHFAPGESHLMLGDLRRPLEAGDRVVLSLTFERAGEVDVEVEVVAWEEALDRIEAATSGEGP
jgi:protein SCO1/2